MEECDSELTLDEFIEQEREIIDAFRKDWVARNADNSDAWPMKMIAEDWDEQLFLFHSGMTPT